MPGDDLLKFEVGKMCADPFNYQGADSLTVRKITRCHGKVVVECDKGLVIELPTATAVIFRRPDPDRLPLTVDEMRNLVSWEAQKLAHVKLNPTVRRNCENHTRRAALHKQDVEVARMVAELMAKSAPPGPVVEAASRPVHGQFVDEDGNRVTEAELLASGREDDGLPADFIDDAAATEAVREQVAEAQGG